MAEKLMTDLLTRKRPCDLRGMDETDFLPHALPVSLRTPHIPSHDVGGHQMSASGSVAVDHGHHEVSGEGQECVAVAEESSTLGTTENPATESSPAVIPGISEDNSVLETSPAVAEIQRELASFLDLIARIRTSSQGESTELLDND